MNRNRKDLMIVPCALQLATQGTEVMVVADDTDVLILLIYHWQEKWQMSTFCLNQAKHRSAGIKLFVHLYGSKQTDSLNNFRYMKFMEMTSCSKKVFPTT